MYICKNACAYTFEKKVFYNGLLKIKKLILTGVMLTSLPPRLSLRV